MKHILILLILISYSCKPSLNKGTIVDKYYEEARDYQSTYPQIMYIGKTMIVNQIPYTAHDDEDYVIVIQENKQQDRVELTKEEFDSYKIGDYFTFKR